MNHTINLTEDEKRYLAFLREYAATNTEYRKRFGAKPNTYYLAVSAWKKQEYPGGLSKSGYFAYAFRGTEYLLRRTGYLNLTDEDGKPFAVEFDLTGNGDTLYTVTDEQAEVVADPEQGEQDEQDNVGTYEAAIEKLADRFQGDIPEGWDTNRGLKPFKKVTDITEWLRHNSTRPGSLLGLYFEPMVKMVSDIYEESETHVTIDLAIKIAERRGMKVYA